MFLFGTLDPHPPTATPKVLKNGFAVKISEWLFSLKSLGLWTHLWTHLPIVWDKVPNKSVFFDTFPKLRIWETHVLTVMKMIDIAIRATCPVWFRLEGTLEDVTEVDWDQIRKSGHIVWSGHPEWWGFVLENVECIYMGFFKAPSWI